MTGFAVQGHMFHSQMHVLRQWPKLRVDAEMSLWRSFYFEPSFPENKLFYKSNSCAKEPNATSFWNTQLIYNYISDFSVSIFSSI